MTQPRIAVQPHSLTVHWPDGRASDFASLWLRDNQREDRDAHSGQRLIDIMDLPTAPLIRSASIDNDTVRVVWDDNATSASFPLNWLIECVPGAAQAAPERDTRRWLEGAAMSAAENFAWISFDAARLATPQRLQWMVRLLQDGVAFVRGVPCTDNGIVEAMASLGQISSTNYGLVFDVRSVPAPENLAYSDRGLGLHTDNPYREPVPGFQSLHALLTSSEGGDSVFADGFALAEHLRTEAPDAFAQLTQTAVPFAYRSKDADLYAERPLIQLSCNGSVAAVHYNSRSIAPLRLNATDAQRFYAAYRRFAALLREPRFQLKFRLHDGDLVMFDNQRILHGRTGFSAQRYPRHLRGCYLSRDSVYSATALLRRAITATVPA